LVRIQAELNAQQEARDRQADAFAAAASRIEIVNGALVGVIALAGVLGAFLAIRWVRQLANEQIALQVETTIKDTGEKIFESDSTALRDEYDAKFAAQYRRYSRLVDGSQ
jgi:hypothetical protein